MFAFFELSGKIWVDCRVMVCMVKAVRWQMQIWGCTRKKYFARRERMKAKAKTQKLLAAVLAAVMMLSGMPYGGSPTVYAANAGKSPETGQQIQEEGVSDEGQTSDEERSEGDGTSDHGNQKGSETPGDGNPEDNGNPGDGGQEEAGGTSDSGNQKGDETSDDGSLQDDGTSDDGNRKEDGTPGDGNLNGGETADDQDSEIGKVPGGGYNLW